MNGSFGVIVSSSDILGAIFPYYKQIKNPEKTCMMAYKECHRCFIC